MRLVAEQAAAANAPAPASTPPVLLPRDSYAGRILYEGGPHPRAPLGRRLLALAIDLAVAAAVVAPAVLLGLASAVQNLQEVNLRYLAPALVFVAVAAVYLLVKDGLPGGASLGKRVAGLEVVHLATGRPCSWWRSAVRTGVWLLAAAVPGGGWAVEPLVAAVAAGGRRLGDHAAGTQVTLRRSP